MEFRWCGYKSTTWTFIAISCNTSLSNEFSISRRTIYGWIVCGYIFTCRRSINPTNLSTTQMFFCSHGAHDFTLHIIHCTLQIVELKNFQVWPIRKWLMTWNNKCNFDKLQVLHALNMKRFAINLKKFKNFLLVTKASTF
jgi:hypothetical protein